MTERPHIESAWPRHPGYRIDLLACPFLVRAWAGDRLVAETTRALRVEETDHQPVMYIPLEDIRLDVMRPSDHHTICPFKGQADYWSLDTPDGDNVLWTYPDPFPEVAGIAGHGAFYPDRIRVELVEGGPGGEARDTHATRFPTWGDVCDLVEVLDVHPEGEGRFVSTPRADHRRGVVEGSQLLGQAIVAAGKTAPDRTVASAHMLFARAAAPDVAVELDVEALTQGRSFSALSVRARQGERLCAPGLILLDTGAPAVIEHDAPAPDVAGPYESVPYDMSVTGRDLRIVDGAYSPEPDTIGPPEIDAWMRYREVPDVDYLHVALLAQFTGHLSIAAAMRPHPGVGESQAHRELSTAILAITLSVHRPVRMTEWLLFSHRSTSATLGRSHAECRVYAEGGPLVASFTVESMVRRPPVSEPRREERVTL